MGAALDFLQEAGVVLTLAAPDRLAASGRLTDDARQFIREHKAELLRELTAANDPVPPDPLPDELRELVGLVAALEGWGWDVPDTLAIMRRQVPVSYTNLTLPTKRIV